MYYIRLKIGYWQGSMLDSSFRKKRLFVVSLHLSTLIERVASDELYFTVLSGCSLRLGL